MSNDNELEPTNGDGSPPPPSAAAPEPATTPDQLPVETAEAKAERLERELSDTKDRMLRIAADYENYKKRVKRSEDEAAVRARETLLREILPVLDNLERATVAVGQASKSGSVESLAQGVRLVEKQLQGALEKFQVKGFESLGQPFDPARHEAIQQLETDEHPAGSVAAVFARGYLIGDRLLRPAMVAVAKPPSKSRADATDPNLVVSDGDGADGANGAGGDGN
jgi:molecular chaperone GrpE